MKRILLVVDYQKDFVDGSLGFDWAKDIDAGIANKIIYAFNNGYDIVCTYDTHEPNYLETQEGRNLPVPHCIVDTDGHKYYGKTALTLKNIPHTEIYKNTFGSDVLLNKLRKIADNDENIEIEICGVVTNICVISNAIIAKTALPEAKIIINEKLCASNDIELHNKAIDIMKNLQMEII